MAVCGIYKITNKETGQCYIGQSIDIFKRLRQHLSDKKYNENDWHQKLQHEPEKYTFEILTRCEQKDLNDMESYYIYKFNACNEGYNKTQGNHSIFKSQLSSNLKSSDNNVEIKQNNNLNKNILLSNKNIISNILNDLDILCINPTIILNNCKELTSIDEDILIFILYCIQHNTEPRAVDFVHLFNKSHNGGHYWKQYKESYNKLLKLGLIYDDESKNLNSDILIPSNYNININFKNYVELKKISNKYCLLIICLLEYTRKTNKNIVSIEDFYFYTPYEVKMLKSRILEPTIKLLNQYYYNKPLSLQFLKESRRYTKIKFIYK